MWKIALAFPLSLPPPSSSKCDARYKSDDRFLSRLAFPFALGLCFILWSIWCHVNIVLNIFKQNRSIMILKNFIIIAVLFVLFYFIVIAILLYPKLHTLSLRLGFEFSVNESRFRWFLARLNSELESHTDSWIQFQRDYPMPDNFLMLCIEHAGENGLARIYFSMQGQRLEFT